MGPCQQEQLWLVITLTVKRKSFSFFKPKKTSPENPWLILVGNPNPAVFKFLTRRQYNCWSHCTLAIGKELKSV